MREGRAEQQTDKHSGRNRQAQRWPEGIGETEQKEREKREGDKKERETAVISENVTERIRRSTWEERKDCGEGVGVMGSGAVSIIFPSVLVVWPFYSWDTAGQERFKTIAAAYYRGANGEMGIFTHFWHRECNEELPKCYRCLFSADNV